MNNKSVVLIILGVISIGIVAFFIIAHRGVNPPPPKNSKIVAYGDSLVVGFGSTKGKDFVSLVSQEIGRPIKNEGKSGDTTASALKRIDDILEYDPGIVILLLGGNDYLRRIPKSETFANLDKIVTSLEKKGAIVLLLGVRGGLLIDTYEKDFKDFAKRRELVYVPNVLDGLIGTKDLMYDQVHPNSKGYEKIAEKVSIKLKEIIED